MNKPVPVAVSIWFVCKLCRGSFPDVSSFLAHKTEKHFDEFKTVKSIIFEERIVKDDVDIDSNFLVASHSPKLFSQDEKETFDVVFDIDSCPTNPRQIEPEKPLEEPGDRQVYTCKFTNANQENAVDFTIEDECVIINISRLNPNLAESELDEEAKSEAVDDEFVNEDKTEILESEQHFHQPEENSEKHFSALSEPEKEIYQHVDLETEDIFYADTLTSNKAFEIEVAEVNSVNFDSAAAHHIATPLLNINADPKNVGALNSVPQDDEIIDVTNITELKTSSFHAVQPTSPAPSSNIDLAPRNFTTVNILSDRDISLTELVESPNHVVNYDATLVSEAQIGNYTEQQHEEESVIASNYHNDLKINFNCSKNPYVLLKRLTNKELELATATRIVDQPNKCQNTRTNLNSISEDSDSDIESDTKPADPEFDPSDVDSNSYSNFEQKSIKSKRRKKTLAKPRLQVTLSVKKPLVCSVCDLSFKYQRQLNDHKWKTHSLKPLSCTYPNCNQTVADSHSLKIHLKRHENPSNTICYVFPLHLDEDGAKTDMDCLPLDEWLKNQLQTHNVIILEPDPLIAENMGHISLTNFITCKLCAKSLTSETEVKIHVKNCWTHNTKLHRFCVQCKQQFDRPYKLKVHNKRVHLTQEEKDVQYPFKCDHCTKKFILPSELKYHQETHKRREERMNVVDCHICGKPGIHKSYLEHHLNTHSNVKPFKCQHPECTKACKTKVALWDHLKHVHSDSRPFPCPQCSYSAKTKEALKIHSFVHTKELRKPLQYFRCAHDNCDKQYLVRQALKRHMKKCHNSGVISDLKIFLCEICKKTFATAVTLRNHRLVHTENREFKCNFAGCSADFKFKFNLVEHEREHSGLKPFVCETCGESYSKLNSFNKHKKSHDNLLNRHLCSHCPRKFPGSWELKQHLLVHEKGAQFICQFCGKKCSKKENLKTHEQSHDNPKKRNQREQRGAKKRDAPKKMQTTFQFQARNRKNLNNYV